MQALSILFYSVLSQLANLEIEGIRSILCSSQPKRAQRTSFLDTPLLKNYLSFLFLSIYLSMQFLDIQFQNQAQYINVVEVLGRMGGGEWRRRGEEEETSSQLAY